eukprot:TRINITY_DN3119_c0_g1_i1.p2 TRINITY_DN3119_c0_g1~~TRINITY_DN3119_c0_g1_i1.p2  ORF type:complete len:145 (-),score=42.98 TRINITY_DN3119_c0_g1_i1:61-441(-)
MRVEKKTDILQVNAPLPAGAATSDLKEDSVKPEEANDSDIANEQEEALSETSLETFSEASTGDVSPATVDEDVAVDGSSAGEGDVYDINNSLTASLDDDLFDDMIDDSDDEVEDAAATTVPKEDGA